MPEVVEGRVSLGDLGFQPDLGIRGHGDDGVSIAEVHPHGFVFAGDGVFSTGYDSDDPVVACRRGIRVRYREDDGKIPGCVEGNEPGSSSDEKPVLSPISQAYA